MEEREELDQILHILRRYTTSILILQTGTQQIETPQQQALLQRRLQVAHAAKADLDGALDRFLSHLHRILLAQQTRLDQVQRSSSSLIQHDEMLEDASGESSGYKNITEGKEHIVSEMPKDGRSHRDSFQHQEENISPSHDAIFFCREQ